MCGKIYSRKCYKARGSAWDARTYDDDDDCHEDDRRSICFYDRHDCIQKCGEAASNLGTDSSVAVVLVCCAAMPSRAADSLFPMARINDLYGNATMTSQRSTDESVPSRTRRAKVLRRGHVPLCGKIGENWSMAIYALVLGIWNMVVASSS